MAVYRGLALALALGLAIAAPASARNPRGAVAATERIDPKLYAAIRQEGLQHSQAMRFATGLADGVGARLMGSPNLRKAYDWAQGQLRDLGAAHVHLEDIGEFGLSWRQDNAWMRMSAPDSMVFVAQAGPWSASSHGVQQGDAIAVELNDAADLDRYRGKLAGKIVLLGPMRATPQPVDPLSVRYSAEALRSGAAVQPQKDYYATRADHLAARSREYLFKAERLKFLQSEHVLALVIPSRDAENAGGTGDLELDNSELGGRIWLAAERPTFPIMFAAIEDFGRAWRLATGGVPVKLQFDVATTDLGEHEHGYNVVADIEGSDPRLASQIVLVGAHLDSWSSGTGATDDGAGVAIALEAVRILRAVGARPRRTIRVVLYGGEEEGLLGSEAYAARHLGQIPRSEDPDQLALPVSGWRRRTGPMAPGPDYPAFDVAYNLDHGDGRIRAVFAGGNPALAAIYRQWIAPLHDLGVQTVFDMKSWPADQSTFTELDLPGVLFLQDPLDYDSRSHHTNMDTVERLSPPDIAQAATVTAIFLINSANRDALLPRPSPVR
ncbi:MAG: M20/M25/M40 family metallo-hydrolase [Proteobacteria bacterium]|nr:M20/M25/M40 family metallo-hydrolase [Pseudomonadota bacterium]